MRKLTDRDPQEVQGALGLLPPPSFFLIDNLFLINLWIRFFPLGTPSKHLSHAPPVDPFHPDHPRVEVYHPDQRDSDPGFQASE